MTPPNCASTPHTLVTSRRRAPSGRPVTTAYAARAPTTPPISAVIAETARLFSSAVSTLPSTSPARFVRLGRPSSTKAPITTVTVGTTRKISR